MRYYKIAMIFGSFISKFKSLIQQCLKCYAYIKLEVFSAQTNSLEEFVTRDSDANERMESSAFEIDYIKQIKLDITALLTESLFLYFSSIVTVFLCYYI